MKAIQLVVLTLVVSALGGLWAQSAAADEAASIYDPSRMHVIRLTLPQKSREGLAADRDKYQPGTFSLAETDGTPGGEGPFSTPVNVKIKLKGSASYRPLSEKSAFKIKFEEAPFRGLRTITLNNMVEDPSMIHETFAYTAFRGAGVPASRTGYAYVYVDGEDFGVHLNIEALDQIALEKLFGSFNPATQHLYEGEDAHDVSPGGAGAFEIDEGEKSNRADLEALIDAVNSSGPPDWATRVAPVADLQEMTRMWAAEKYIGQWDGYAGSEAEWLPNNYYLYSEPSGRFKMMPWGNDESWQTAYACRSTALPACCSTVAWKTPPAPRSTGNRSWPCVRRSPAWASTRLRSTPPQCSPRGSRWNRLRARARSTASRKSGTKWPTPAPSSRLGRGTLPSGSGRRGSSQADRRSASRRPPQRRTCWSASPRGVLGSVALGWRKGFCAPRRTPGPVES
jgi:hypothetical protein